MAEYYLDDLEPIWELDQRLKNVTVEILVNRITGEYSIAWEKQDNTEDITCEEYEE